MTSEGSAPAFEPRVADLPSLKIVREALPDDDLQAALAYLGVERLPPSSRLFVLVDLDEEAAFPAAAVVVRSQGRVWRVERARSPAADAPRLAAELVRLTTGGGAAQLVSAPPPESGAGVLLRAAPLSASICNGWVVVDL